MTYVDDIDREELTEDEVRVVEFGYRGADYVLDLSELNAAILDEELEPYLEVARKKPRGSGVRTPAPKGQKSDSARNKRIRDWANANGRAVSARGKIAADVISDYEAANPQDR